MLINKSDIAIGSIFIAAVIAAIFAAFNPEEHVSAQVSGQPYQGAVGPVPNFSIGTVTAVPYGTLPSIVITGSSANPVMNVAMETGQTGSAGANGTNGSNAVATAARATTDTSGLYAWTYPASCLNAGHIPYITAVAEGPNPQAGSNVNVQLEGAPSASMASFRVTKTANTTVALLGLTITVAVTGASIGATTLDLGCSPQ